MTLFGTRENIVSGIEYEIRNGLDRSIETGNLDIFNKLQTFISEILVMSVREKNLSNFRTYVHFPNLYVSFSHSGTFQISNLERTKKHCFEAAVSQLRQIISYAIPETEIESEQGNLNNYYYLSFVGFSNILYTVVRLQDLNKLRQCIELLDQLSTRSRITELYDLKNKISDPNRSSTEVKELVRKYKVFSQYYNYCRHVKMGIKYWTYFLYSVKQLNSTQTKSTLKAIGRIDYRNAFEDLLVLGNSVEMHDYLGWDNWDYKERVVGSVYTPPNLSSWVLHGFVLDVAFERTNEFLLSDFESFSLNEIKSLIYLSEELVDTKTNIERNFSFWNEVLDLENKRNFIDSVQPLLDRLSELKRTSITDRDRRISKAKISNKQLQKFIETVGGSWKKSGLIRYLFEREGNTIKATKDDELKFIGNLTFFEGAKRMFIEGQDYKWIYHVEIFGGNIGRWEDDEFCRQIEPPEENHIEKKSTVEILEKGINELSRKGIVPTLILIHSKLRLDKSLWESKSFIEKSPKEISSNQNFVGYFNEIPIYSVRSSLFSSKILIADFPSSFSMKVRTNRKWYEHLLKIEVEELTYQEAKNRFLQNPERWSKNRDGYELDPEDSITMIMTSILLEIGTAVQYEINDFNSFVAYRKMDA